MLSHVVERCQAILPRFPVYVITPPCDRDLYPEALAPDCDENDVLARHVLAAQTLGADAIMRVTSDCPFLDPQAAKNVLSAFMARSPGIDYCANDLVQTYPDGLGVEIVTYEALHYAHLAVHPSPSLDNKDRVHVTPYVRRHLRGLPCSHRGNPQGKALFEGVNLRCPTPSVEWIKLSVDTPTDITLARSLYAVGGLLPGSYALVNTLVAYRKVQEHGQTEGAD